MFHNTKFKNLRNTISNAIKAAAPIILSTATCMRNDITSTVLCNILEIIRIALPCFLKG